MATTTTSPRYFGRCLVRGCKHRTVVDASSSPALVVSGAGLFSSLVIQDPADSEQHWTMTWHGHQESGARQLAAHVAAGIACPTHRRPLEWKRGVFMLTPERSCNGSCTHATDRLCMCQCGGANHGQAHLLVVGR